MVGSVPHERHFVFDQAAFRSHGRSRLNVDQWPYEDETDAHAGQLDCGPQMRKGFRVCIVEVNDMPTLATVVVVRSEGVSFTKRHADESTETWITVCAFHRSHGYGMHGAS